MAHPVWHTADQKSAVGTATSLTVARPDNVAEGDELLAFWMIRNTGAVLGTGVPEGWELVDEYIGGSPVVRVFRKTATASEPVDYTFTYNEGQPSALLIGRVTGAAGRLHIEAMVGHDIIDTSITLPEKTGLSNEDYLRIAAFACQTNSGTHNGVTVTDPAGFSELFGDTSQATFSAGVWQEDMSGTTASTVTATNTNVRWGALYILIRDQGAPEDPPVWNHPGQKKASGIGTSLTVDRPDNVVEGDLLVAQYSVKDGHFLESDLTVPSGWTLARLDNGGGSSYPVVGIWYKIAGASEPNEYTWGHNGGSRAQSLVIGRVVSYDAADPIAGTSETANETGSSTSLPEIAALTSGDYLRVLATATQTNTVTNHPRAWARAGASNLRRIVDERSFDNCSFECWSDYFRGGAAPAVTVSSGASPRWAGVMVAINPGTDGSDPDGESTAPQISTTSLPNATVGEPYSETLQATGGTEPYTWSVISGSLPSGLSLNASTGEISGTPTTEESQTFTVQVTDDASETDTQELTITVVPDPFADCDESEDYSTSAIGTEWVQEWDPNAAWTIDDDPEAEAGGKTCELTSAPASDEPAILRWAEVGNQDNVRITVRWWADSNSTFSDEYVGVGARLSGAVGSENGYCVRSRSSTGAAERGFRLVKYVDGVKTTLAFVDADTWTRRSWNRMVLEVSGSDIRVMVWPESESPPVEWQAEVSDSDLSTGGVGLYAWNNRAGILGNKWDWMCLEAPAPGPLAPTVDVAVDGTQIFASTGQMVAVDGGSGDHTATQWQVREATDSDWSNPERDITSTTHLTDVLMEGFAESTTYEVRARHRDGPTWGEWSAPAEAVTETPLPKPDTPTVTVLDQGEDYGQVEQSAFSHAEGVGDGEPEDADDEEGEEGDSEILPWHLASEWEIRLQGGALVLETGPDTGLTDLVQLFDELDPDTAYEIRVRHQDGKYGTFSDWSAWVLFSTDPIPPIRPDKPTIQVDQCDFDEILTSLAVAYSHPEGVAANPHTASRWWICTAGTVTEPNGCTSVITDVPAELTAFTWPQPREGEFFLAVQVMDDQERWSERSDFVACKILPRPPQLEVGECYAGVDENFLLHWGLPTGGDVAYEAHVSCDDGETWRELFFGLREELTEFLFDIQGREDGNCLVRIRACEVFVRPDSWPDPPENAVPPDKANVSVLQAGCVFAVLEMGPPTGLVEGDIHIATHIQIAEVEDTEYLNPFRNARIEVAEGDTRKLIHTFERTEGLPLLVEPDKEHRARVAFEGLGGVGPWSDEVLFVTPCVTAQVPNAPTPSLIEAGDDFLRIDPGDFEHQEGWTTEEEYDPETNDLPWPLLVNVRVSSTRPGHVEVREVWSFDAPDTGEVIVDGLDPGNTYDVISRWVDGRDLSLGPFTFPVPTQMDTTGQADPDPPDLEVRGCGEWVYIPIGIDRTGAVAVVYDFSELDEFPETWEVSAGSGLVSWALVNSQLIPQEPFVGILASNPEHNTRRISKLMFRELGQPVEFDASLVLTFVPNDFRWHFWRFAYVDWLRGGVGFRLREPAENPDTGHSSEILTHATGGRDPWYGPPQTEKCEIEDLEDYLRCRCGAVNCRQCTGLATARMAAAHSKPNTMVAYRIASGQASTRLYTSDRFRSFRNTDRGEPVPHRGFFQRGATYARRLPCFLGCCWDLPSYLLQVRVRLINDGQATRVQSRLIGPGLDPNAGWTHTRDIGHFHPVTGEEKYPCGSIGLCFDHLQNLTGDYGILYKCVSFSNLAYDPDCADCPCPESLIEATNFRQEDS